MDDLDRILSVVGNPTRRMILELLVREPNYPLQISKELGISQQSVAKNLEVMERNGLVEKTRVRNESGPDRMLYRPNESFSITIDMGNGRFTTRIYCPGSEVPSTMDMVEDARKRISDMDREIEALEHRMRSLIDKRNEAVESAFQSARGPSMEQPYGDLFYHLLNSPSADVTDLAHIMHTGEEQIEFMLRKIGMMLKE